MNITLITDVLPDNDFTAGQVLRNMLATVDADRVSVLWINQSQLNRAPRDPLYTIDKTYHFGFKGELGAFLHRVVQWLGPTSPFSTIVQMIVTLWFCMIIAVSILRTLRRRSRDEYLWLVLQGEKLLVVYALVSLFARQKIILHQWDPLSWWMGHHNHRPEAIRLMQRLLNRVQQRVWINIVPSLPWEAKLRANGCQAVRICHFFPEQELQVALSDIRLCTPGKLNVVFIGQLYANKELDACLEALKNNARRLRLRLVLHYFGSGKPAPTNDVELVNHGYRDRMDIVAMIAKWDLALLPYPCQPKYEETARMSFPSKSRVYAAAGLPIMAYAPSNSSVEQFFALNYSPYYVNAKLQNDLTDFLTTCVDTAPAGVRRRREHTRSVVARWFSAEAEINNLVQLLRA
jgi:hypothetical protein